VTIYISPPFSAIPKNCTKLGCDKVLNIIRTYFCFMIFYFIPPFPFVHTKIFDFFLLSIIPFTLYLFYPPFIFVHILKIFDLSLYLFRIIKIFLVDFQ